MADYSFLTNWVAGNLEHPVETKSKVSLAQKNNNSFGSKTISEHLSK